MIKVADTIIQPRFFPDGTFNLTDLGGDFTAMQEGARWRTANFWKVEWRWENPNEYMLLYFIVNHLRERCGTCLMHLYLPYIPDARMDRVKKPYSELFTLKYFAKFINDLHFDEVHVLDPHSNVAAALINNIQITWPTRLVKKIVDENNIDILCFPDDGAMKRYSDECDFRPFIYGKKKRDWSTGQIKGVQVRNPMNLTLDSKRILIVDDICSKGGTFFYMGKAIKEVANPESIDLFVSHCENSVFDGNLLSSISPINHIYTTNSLKRDISPAITTMKIWEE